MGKPPMRIHALRLRSLLFAAFALLSGLAADLRAEPLHAQIDRLITTSAEGPAATVSDDFEFVRRIYLDLAGRIPTADEVRAFRDNPASDKRAQLIDQLLAGPDYPRRMQELFHVMLMERLGDHPEWTKFLQTSFEQNKPWDQMTREILSPNPEDETIRGAAFFWTKRLENYGQNPVDLPGLARDVGRMFLGRDLQCAQCHDHLFIDDYKQVDFQGLMAFIGHTSIRQDTAFPAVAEGLVEKKTEFMSVFIKEQNATGPRLPGGMEVEIPELPKDEKYVVPPDRAKKFPGVPKFSPLRILSEQLPAEDNTQFAENIANRLWYVMLGRGLVHPLDLHHSANPPSHPELLKLLAREFVAHKFDIKWMLREIALSETYQRSSVLPEGVENAPPEKFLVALEKPLSAEQLVHSMLQATGEIELLSQKEAAKAEQQIARHLDRFRDAFANPPREPEVEFSPSVKAALFVMNSSAVLDWLKPRDGNLAGRLAKISEPSALAEELYLSVLSRPASDEEQAEVADFLASQPDRDKAIGHLIWALMASTEFCVNH